MNRKENPFQDDSFPQSSEIISPIRAYLKALALKWWCVIGYYSWWYIRSKYLYRTLHTLRENSEAVVADVVRKNGTGYSFPILIKNNEQLDWITQAASSYRYRPFSIKRFGAPDADDFHRLLFYKLEFLIRKEKVRPGKHPPWNPEDLFDQRAEIWRTPTDYICGFEKAPLMCVDPQTHQRVEIEQHALILEINLRDGRRFTWIVIPSLSKEYVEKLSALLNREDLIIGTIELADPTNPTHLRVGRYWHSRWYGETPLPDAPCPPEISNGFLQQSLSINMNVRTVRLGGEVSEHEDELTLLPIAELLDLDVVHSPLEPVPDDQFADPRAVIHGQYAAISPNASNTVGFAQVNEANTLKKSPSSTLFGLDTSVFEE